LLLLFAASHFAAFKVHRLSQQMPNAVFPFFTNQTMYLLAGALETVTAAVCLKGRGRAIANLGILNFILIIIWYRWSLSHTGGGNSCECLGILGSVLHLSRAQEKVLPIIALVLLITCIIPWLVRSLAKRKGLIWRKLTAAGTSGLLLTIFHCHACYGEQTIEISGNYVTERCSGLTGAVIANDGRNIRAVFTCKFSGAAWSIFATNIATEGRVLKTPWEGLVYDGTNTYTFAPNYEHPFEKKVYPVRVTISPEPLFLRDYDERLHIDVLWLAYGLSPRLAPTNHNGAIEIPLPWWAARRSALARGYEWKITPSADGRFVSECTVLRNTNLDLSLREELRRPDMGFTFGAFDESDNGFVAGLDTRHSIPHGWLEATYKCTDWFNTNGVLLPRTSEELRYSHSVVTEWLHPTFRARITASALVVRQGLQQLLPPVTQPTLVADYRYRRADEKFAIPCLEYELSPGSSWKSDKDEKLVNQANIQFKRARSFLAPEQRARYLAWLVLPLFLLPLAIFLFQKRKRQSATKTT